MMTPKRAKEHCGYEPKPVLPTCGNCAAFTSDWVVPEWFAKMHPDGTAHGKPLTEYAQEKNLRCSDHGFAIKKMASCKLFRPLAQSAQEGK